MRLAIVAAIAPFLTATAVCAQTAVAPAIGVGKVARSASGEIGTRQERSDSGNFDVQPLERLSTRVQNRVQSRLRTRLDRYYNPQGGAADPFAVAEAETRTGGRRRR